MASTPSPILKLELIGNGDQSGTWGTTTNTNLGTLIEQAIAGTATIDVTAGNVTLTSINYTADQARCAALLITGTPGTTRNVIAPAVSKLYVVSNTSNAAVVIKTSVSTGYTIPAGTTVLVYYNGSEFILVGQASASTNTANALVLRDSSGNFAANNITANNITASLVTSSLSGRVIPRVVAAGATSGTITPTGDTADLFTMLGLTGTVTVAIPSGTPTNGQKLILRYEDNGTARAFTWTTTAGGYRAIGVVLPTTTIPNKLGYVGCIYNSTDNFWDVVAYSQEA